MQREKEMKLRKQRLPLFKPGCNNSFDQTTKFAKDAKERKEEHQLRKTLNTQKKNEMAMKNMQDTTRPYGRNRYFLTTNGTNHTNGSRRSRDVGAVHEPISTPSISATSASSVVNNPFVVSILLFASLASFVVHNSFVVLPIRTIRTIRS
ncbi:hypothetical protein ACFL6U_08370 [Planctomycetota bacterium]